MKNNLRNLGLAFGLLPVFVFTSVYASAAQTLIPAGTTVPVRLNSALRSDKSEAGSTITATVMQDVALGAGQTLRAGSRVTGHVIEAVAPGRGSDEARVSFEFDQVRSGDRNIRIDAGLIALASVMEVDAAQVPVSGGSEDYSGNGSLVQIGGNEVSYGQYGPVLLGSEVVGNYTPQGVLANAGKATKGDQIAQAYWLFSVNASGVYGFRGVQIQRSESARPGEVTLSSNRKVLKVGKGSAMLLRVGGEPEAAQSGESLPAGTASTGMAQ